MLSPAIGAQLARDLVAYATSLTDAEWALVAPFLPAPAETGRPHRWPMRAILDAVLYVLRTGCALGRLRLPPCGTDDRLCRSWRHLPHEFPPWPTVHRWFLRLSWSGVFERLAHALTMRDRARVGREASPAGAVVDAQAARSGGVGVAGARSDDPARRVVGRKRHALTDTDGRLLLAVISPAGLHDSHGGVALLRASRQPWPFLARCLADRACAGERVAAAASVALTIVAAPEGQKGFAVHPRRPPTGNAGRSQANRSELCSDGSSNAPSAGSAAAAGRRATTKRHHPPRSPSSSSPPPWSSSGVSPGRSETGSDERLTEPALGEPEADQGGGEAMEGLGDIGPTLVAEREAAHATEPGQRALHHPAFARRRRLRVRSTLGQEAQQACAGPAARSSRSHAGRYAGQHRARGRRGGGERSHSPCRRAAWPGACEAIRRIAGWPAPRRAPLDAPRPSQHGAVVDVRRRQRQGEGDAVRVHHDRAAGRSSVCNAAAVRRRPRGRAVSRPACRGRSGSGRSLRPPFRRHGGAVERAAAPVDRVRSAQPVKQHPMEPRPYPGRLPVPKPAPATHPAAAPHLLWQHLPSTVSRRSIRSA